MRWKKLILCEILVIQSLVFVAKIRPYVNLTRYMVFQEETYNVATTVKRQQQKQPGKVWWCGWPNGYLAQQLFPDYQYMGILNITETAATNQSSTNDVLLFGMNGPCPGLPIENIPAILSHFQGKVLMANGEPIGSIDPKDDDEANGGRVFQIGGPVLPQHSSGPPSDVEYYKHHIIRGVYFGMYDSVNGFPDKLHHILDPSQRPHWQVHNDSKIIYTQSNCIEYRQHVVYELAKHFQVETGGRCKVAGAKRVPFSGLNDYSNNWRSAYSKYKYCVTMENTVIEGYMSEKIIFGFMAGCLPIYYGNRETFNPVLNPDAFLFVEAEKDGGADELVKAIQYLEQNQTAYEEKLAAPILRNGRETINQFWSLSDSIGDGSLKGKIRTRMGL